MKRFFTLFIIFIVIIGCKNNRIENNSHLDTHLTSINDTASLLARFFSPLNFEKGTIAVWKPSMDDLFNMPLSFDSLCRTKLDTIIDINDKVHIALFRTDWYSENKTISSCHICAPTYSIATIEKDTTGYSITSFKKDLFSAGSFGHGYDSLTLEGFGKGNKLIRFLSSYTGTSNVTNQVTYFDLHYYEKMFSYFTYDESGDSTKLDPNFSVTEQKLIHIPQKNSDADDIELSGYITSFDKNSKTYIKHKNEEYYKADAFGVYKRYIKPKD